MPLSAIDTKIANELSRLIKIGSEIVTNAKNTTEQNRFQVSAENILSIRFGSNSCYYKSFMESFLT